MSYLGRVGSDRPESNCARIKIELTRLGVALAVLDQPGPTLTNTRDLACRVSFVESWPAQRQPRRTYINEKALQTHRDVAAELSIHNKYAFAAIT